MKNGTQFKLSSYGGRKTVDVPLTIKYLPDDRVDRVTNLKLNDNAMRIFGRMTRDNPQTLFTKYGFQFFKNVGLLKFKNVTKKRNGKFIKRKVPDYTNSDVVRYAQNYWAKLLESIDASLYPIPIYKSYIDFDKISFRSIYLAIKYFKRLAKYGHNSEKQLSPWVRSETTAWLETTLRPFFSKEIFDFDLEEYVIQGKWLSHIKTGSNSGHPFYVPQSKMLLSKTVKDSLRIFEKWKSGEKIYWEKLAFSLGSRTERDLSQRVVCMASTYEKPIGAIINTIFDENVEEFPIKLPRSYGTINNMCTAFIELLSEGLSCVSKDLEAYDTSIPIELLELLRDWFKGVGTTLAMLIAFEIDLIIHSVMIVGPKQVFRMKSLPSGIGITQLLGSLIHALIDHVSGYVFALVVYQSDDTVGFGNIDIESAKLANEKINHYFGMKISPFNKKSMFSEHAGIMVQKVFDAKLGIWYNHEQRAYTNGFWQERKLNVDEDLKVTLGMTTEEVKPYQQALGFLGNIGSYNYNAPLLPKILAMRYGEKLSGYKREHIEIALTKLEEWVPEQHKTHSENAWVRHLFNSLMDSKGWESPRFTVKDFSELLRAEGRTI